MAPFVDWLWVGAGGFLGANARYWLGRAIATWLGAAFPWSTLIVNATGSFAIGVLLTLFTERFVADPAWRLLLVVGFLGGYTTFSSYTFEALALTEQGLWAQAFFYVVGSNALGLTAVALGAILARVL
ncbi:MAG: fluoride efflux transporter CrcB [Chloroflexota bacterium]